MDSRLVAYIIWGIGTTVVWGMVWRHRYAAYTLHRDGRSLRALISGTGLFLTAFASNLAILMVLFGNPGTGARGFFIALALGAFFAAGLISASGEKV